MGEWDNIGQSSISHAGPKLSPGNTYLLEIGQALYKSDLSNGPAYIVEMCVHESSDPLLPPGTRPSWTANKKHKNTNGNILCFNGAVHGIDPKNEAVLRSSITGQHIEYGISAANPLRGKFVRATTLAHTTEAGHPFTIVHWAPHGLAQVPATRLNDPPVAAGVAAPSAPVAPQVSMPGAFNGFPSPAPSAPAPGGFPGFPSNGLPAPQGLMGLSTVPPVSVPQMGAPMGPPSSPGFPPVPQAGPPSFPQPGGFPQIPSMGAPSFPQIPQVAPKPWPPAGWAAHPTPGYFYQLGTQNFATEAELRAKQAAGQV